MKRIFAAALVLALAVSLLPTVFAISGWEENRQYVYEFSQASHGISYNGNASMLSASYNQKIDGTAEGYLPWGYVGSQDRASVATTAVNSVPANALIWTFYLDIEVEDVNGVTSIRTFDPDSIRNQRALMLEIEVQEAGTFRPELEYVANSASVIMEYHLVKKNEGETGYDGSALSSYVKKLTTATRLGVIDQSEGNGIVKFPVVTLEKGNYYLVAIPVASNPDCTFRRNAATATSNPNRAYAVNYIKKLTFSKAYEATEEIVFNYKLNSQSFNLQSVQLVNGDEADEGYLGYWGADNNDNKNRSAAGGWVGVAITGTSSAVVRNATTYGDNAHKYMNKEKTDPWKFYSRSHNNVYIDGGQVYMNCTKVNGNSAALNFEIEIPVTGKYKLDLIGVKGETTGVGTSTVIQGADGAVYFVKSSSAPANSLLTSDKKLGTYKFYEAGLKGTKAATETMGTIEVSEPGTYYVVVQLRKDEGAKDFANALIPEGVTSSEYATHYLARVRSITLTRTGLLDDEVAVDTEKEEEVSVETGNVTPEDINVSTEAVVSALAAYLGGGEISSEVISIEKVSAGEDVTLTAPTDKEGYKFLYWAKAANSSRIVVSADPEYTFRPVLGANNSYIAVYESENAEKEDKAEFYDGNGQLLETYKENAVAPELPTMPGFGKAKYWALYGSDETLSEGDPVEISGTKMYVAYYEEDTAPSVPVTINGETENAEYGKLYELSASSRSATDASKVFCYWEKNGEIVSFDKNYSFYAAEACTVNAVYGNYAPEKTTLRKVLFSAIEGRVHAEFIGLSDAVEKGIIYGSSLIDATHRLTMKTSGNQFTFVDDVNKDYVAYAILPDGKIVYSK
ncbi:MAG: hypothetical protein E7473_01545 [Ruminococcaceae bacterium]|nr:hypothetical protein [Oscillospiraceae bacterium]